MLPETDSVITANANDIARITHKNAAALFSANALPRQLQTLHFCLRSDSGFPPAVRFAADDTPYCKLKTLRTAFSVPYNNVRRARLHILCVENTPPKNKKQPNKRLPFFGELSAAIFCNSKQPNDRRYQQNRCRSNNNSGEYAAADKVCFRSCAHIFFRDLSLFEKFFQIRGNIIAPAESVCQY